jgi:hypothetical protein
MAIEYRLILEGEIPPEAMARGAFPEPSDLPAPEVAGRNTIWDLWDRFGFIMQTRISEDGDFSGESDGAVFFWRPARYTVLYFRLDKFSDFNPTENVKTIVSRVLESGDEDAAVLQNGDIIVLRLAGKLTKYGSGVNWKV